MRFSQKIQQLVVVDFIFVEELIAVLVDGDDVAGTGGESHYNDLGTPLPNSEVFNGTTFGVLELTLAAGTYTWQFIPVAGQSFTDSGSGTCH